MIKSLLRFFSDVAVVVHDDGTLGDRDVRMLERHVRGIRVIRREDADRKINRALKSFPFCRKYRDARPNALQLFDVAATSRSGKAINIDSDILFFRRPVRLINWMRSDNKEILYSFEPRPWKQKEFLAHFRCGFPPHFNLGLFCFYTDIVDLDVIEAALRQEMARLQDDSPIGIGDMKTQNYFTILMWRSRRRYRAHPLAERCYQGSTGIGPNPTARHYHSVNIYMFRSFRRFCLSDMARVIRELKRYGPRGGQV